MRDIWRETEKKIEGLSDERERDRERERGRVRDIWRETEKKIEGLSDERERDREGGNERSCEASDSKVLKKACVQKHTHTHTHTHTLTSLLLIFSSLIRVISTRYSDMVAATSRLEALIGLIISGTTL